MGMGTEGQTPNPDEKAEVKPADAPKGEMYPQDGTDRSLDLDQVRRELAMRDPSLAVQFEKRDEKQSAKAKDDEPKADEAE